MCIRDRPNVKGELKKFEYLVCQGNKLEKHPPKGLDLRTLHRGEKLHTIKKEHSPKTGLRKPFTEGKRKTRFKRTAKDS